MLAGTGVRGGGKVELKVFAAIGEGFDIAGEEGFEGGGMGFMTGKSANGADLPVDTCFFSGCISFSFCRWSSIHEEDDCRLVAFAGDVSASAKFAQLSSDSRLGGASDEPQSPHISPDGSGSETTALTDVTDCELDEDKGLVGFRVGSMGDCSFMLPFAASRVRVGRIEEGSGSILLGAVGRATGVAAGAGILSALPPTNNAVDALSTTALAREYDMPATAEPAQPIQSDEVAPVVGCGFAGPFSATGTFDGRAGGSGCGIAAATFSSFFMHISMHLKACNRTSGIGSRSNGEIAGIAF